MTPFKLSLTAALVGSALLLAGCGEKQQATTPAKAEQRALTEADALAFLAETETKLVQLYKESNRAEWIYANFITEDTASLAADVNEKLTVEMVNLASAAAKFDQVALSADSRRKLDKLKLALTLPAPQDAAKTAEMAKIVAELGGMYGKGKYCKADGSCLSLGEMSAIMASSRDYDEQLAMWQGWREISKPMRPLYTRLIELTNEGAKELGYADTGAMWRSKYDMPADDFAKAEATLMKYARSARLLGPAGSGQLAKMVNQICIAGVVQGLAEAMHFAQQAGLDGQAVLDTISKGAAQSWQMENRGSTMLQGKYDFGFAVDWMRKDLAITLNEARHNGATLPLTALVDQFYAQVQAMGGGRWDTSSLLTVLQRKV